MDKLICVIPKNARLKLCRQISLNWLKENKISYSEFLEVRGEDVPLFVEKLIKEGKNAVGVTGEDLFKEWQLQNPSSNLFLIKKEEWKDSTSVQLFGKPTLCLLGPKNKKLEDLNKNLRVCISSKYKNLAKHYLNNLETKGFKFEKIYVAGSAEETFIKGLADLVVDIVYTGESSKNAGLEVYDEIFSSNVVIIGKTENIINKFYLENLAPGQKEKILKRYRFKLENVKKQIEPLIKDVKLRGDDAIIELIKKFDNISLTRAQLKVSKEEIKEAYKKVDPEIIEAIKTQIEYSKKFHLKQKREKEWKMENEKGVIVGEIFRPIDSVGLYVPGGKAPYPTVMQILAVPAKIAGVRKIIACTPRAAPEVIIAADLAGVDEIYKIGGPQAIAAMAYGTETVPKVEKIVGPGNIYVTSAKITLAEEIAIDMPAGPSEALIIADSNANPAHVAADMLARAEHDEDATAVLITTDEQLAEKTIEELKKQKETLSRKDVIEKALLKYSAVIIAKTMEEVIKFANEYAPEHLEIMVEDPWEVLKEINNAGSIFLGYFAPVAVGDYASGVNHVIPTSQYAKAYSPIGVDTFLKRSEFEYLTKEGITILNEKIVKKMAKVEGFDAHARSVSIRCSKNDEEKTKRQNGKQKEN